MVTFRAAEVWSPAPPEVMPVRHGLLQRTLRLSDGDAHPQNGGRISTSGGRVGRVVESVDVFKHQGDKDYREEQGYRRGPFRSS